MTESEFRKIIREEVSLILGKQLYNKREAAEYLGVCYRTLELWSRTGIVKATVIGKNTMFKVSDLNNCGRPKFKSNIKQTKP